MVYRRVCSNTACLVGVPPQGSKLEASLQPVGLFPQQLCICRFSFVFIGARVRYADPYWAVNGKISALSWHLSTHSVSGGPAAPQCGLQSPLRNGPQNLSSLLATLTHNSHLSTHIGLCCFYISMPLHTVPPKLSYILPLLVHSTLS